LEASYLKNFYTNTSDDNVYPEIFHSPDSFGYNGDYVLFGSSQTPSINYYMVVDNTDSTAVLTEPFNSDRRIIASDHLPVYATVTAPPQNGGRRRRNSTRKHIMKNSRTKKTLLKKPRSSHRKRKVNTHKK
jgi:hypothetical protein